MADAEIIQLGSHGPAGRGSRTSPSAAARTLAGDAPPPEEDPATEPDEARPDEAPPTLSLSALVLELATTLQQAFEGLAGSSFAPVRDFAADPWRSLVTLTGQLGVEWPQ